MHETITRANRALQFQFMAFGASLGVLGGSIPALSARTGITVSELGVGLTLFTIGYIAAMSLGGFAMRVLSRRSLMILAIPVQAVLMVLLELAASPAMLMAMLPVFATVSGFIDLVMNADGAALERRAARPLLARLHGAASVGFALGAIAGSFIAADGGALAAGLAGAAMILGGLGAIVRMLPGGTAVSAATIGRRLPINLVVVIIGLVVGVNLAGETAVQMWSGRLLALQAPDLVAYSGLGAAFFAVFQSGPRLMGDRLRRMFGDRRLVAGSLAVATLGFSVIGLSPAFGYSVAGFALVGLGSACVVPCCFAMAVAVRPDMGGAVLAATAFIAGIPRIATPTLFGIVADRMSLSTAFGMVAIGLAVAIALALALPRRQNP